MATKKEKEEMRKALQNIDNKWEALSYIFTYRQKEVKNIIIIFQSAIILYFILKYTPALDIIIRLIERLLGV